MVESESKNEKPQKERRLDPELLKKGLRCDLEQYEFIKECSEKGTGGIKEWNEWRKENPNEEILLEGADLRKTFLATADLSFAHLEETNLDEVILSGARLVGTHLERSSLQDAKLQDWRTASGFNVGSADFRGSHLQSAIFQRAIVDGSTSFFSCRIDHNTDFRGVGLSNARIDQGTKQLLDYNIRRKNWEEWYPKHIFLRWPIRWFWSVSNYGLSIWRIIGWFLMLSLFFAAAYSNISCWYPEGIVSNLTVEPHLPLWHYFILCILRPIYFSVVTMTTLGFGDMYANEQSIWGHLPFK